MIELIAIALFALLAGILTTARFYEKRISKMKTRHNAALIAEFHTSFRAGWDEGVEYGARMERLDQITNRLLTKS